MKKLLFGLTLVLILFASCKIKTHIHFNKDNSGTVTIEYDLTGMLAQSGGVDSTGIIDSMRESLQKFDTLSFLKKYKVNKTENGVVVSYSFDNLEDLNNSFHRFMDGDNMMEKATGKFTAKRKKMSYELIAPESKKEDDEIVSSMDTEGLFDWEFKVSFEKTIKKCSNSKYTLNKEDHSISLKGSLSTFQDPKSMNFSVKLK